MPREHKSRRELLDIIKAMPSLQSLLAMHDGHYEYELDLEVTVYGRAYGANKKVGPYIRLLTYDPGEPIIKEGDWGGNTFFIVADGNPEVYINPPEAAGREIKVAEIPPGVLFGEMSVLAGVPRNATVKGHSQHPTKILELQRPALRLLRKLDKFNDALDRSYRNHGRDSMLEAIKLQTGLSDEILNQLKTISTFRVFAKNHTLFRQGEEIRRVYIIKQGWIHRRQDMPARQPVEDYLGMGFCLGLEGIMKNDNWAYGGTLMSRAEVLEISTNKLRAVPALRGEIVRALAKYEPPTLGARIALDKPITNEEVRKEVLQAQQDLISTGLVDGNNLLVMDMDLCVRCGNCSLACHKIHGRSRLARRGVHITRLEAPKLGAVQSILSPEVCMHCADPECLTGCPTGAIGRYELGQVDINPKTCIGCGDCASQCPYNAISMIERNPKVAETKVDFAWKLKDFLRLQPDPVPVPVMATEDLVAVKCNLCTGTTMNPEGSKEARFSCEENCPTGALARINPKTYFAEIGQIQGLLQLDKTHAIGRNIHKKDPPRTNLHMAGIGLSILLFIATLFGFQKFGMGGSMIGILNMRWITGLVGLVGIALVMTYPFRRQVYTKRKGALRYWLLVHGYAGVIAGFMILLHGGSDSGGWLTTTLMWAWDVVIGTGIFGILLYLIVPRLMTKIEESPLLIDDLKIRREELQVEISRLTNSSQPQTQELIKRRVLPRFLSAGYLIRNYLQREPLEEMMAAAKGQFDNEIKSAGADRTNVEKVVEDAVALRRVDALIYLHQSLKLWLPPHVLATSLMLALLIVHIIQVVYFVAR